MRKSSPTGTPGYAWPFVALVVGLLLGGCFGPPAPPSDPRPPQSLYAGEKAFANYDGNWSQLPGTYKLYLLTTYVEKWNGTAWIDFSPRCPTLGLWGRNDTKQQLGLDNKYALHPTDPGNLSAIWIYDQHWGDKCHYYGFFGINEDRLNRDVPIMIAEGRNVLSTNVTIERSADWPPFHTITVNGHQVGDQEKGNWTFEATDPRNETWHNRARAYWEPLGVWPISGIRRI